MSHESLVSNGLIESDIAVADSRYVRTRTILSWLTAGLLTTGAGLGAAHYLLKDEKPCESHTTLDGSFSSMSRSLKLTDGSTINYQIFDKVSDLNREDPRVKVTADGNSHTIEAFNTPGPEAVFVVNNINLLINAEGDTISTSCAPKTTTN